MRTSRIILCRIIDHYHQERKSQIEIDGLVTILADYVVTFSELDGLLDGCNTTRLNL